MMIMIIVSGNENSVKNLYEKAVEKEKDNEK